MSPTEDLSTKDLDLSAFLHASGVKIVDVRRNEVNKTVFVFSGNGGETQKMSLKFYNHEDQISASKLLWSLQQIKNMLYELPDRPRHTRG